MASLPDSTDAIVSSQNQEKNQISPSVNYLGDAWDPNVRTFTFVHDYLIANANIPARRETNFSGGIMPHNVPRIRDFIMANPRAEITECSMVIHFNMMLRDASAFLWSVPNWASDVAPATTAGFEETPGCVIETSHSTASGGVPSSLKSQFMIGQYGASSQIKPPPLVGAQPRYNYYLKLFNENAITLTANAAGQLTPAALGMVVFYVRVRRF